LAQRHNTIISSTLVFVRRSARQGTTGGGIIFTGGYRLVVRERVNFIHDSIVLTRYGYEVWRGEQKLYWYDSQPHPNEPTLAVTHPHHKHIPPDIKHNRIPAPGLSFTQPNLPLIIAEIEQTLLAA
jgi:hypothetical protein